MSNQEIKHFRIINSEEVIAEIIAETKNTYVLKNPYMVVELPETVSLAKYVPFSADQSVEIKKEHVITATELHEEMIRYYHNTISISRNASDKAMQGLAQVNNMMEEYLFEGTVASSLSMEMMDQETRYTSNTVH